MASILVSSAHDELTVNKNQPNQKKKNQPKHLFEKLNFTIDICIISVLFPHFS